MQGQSVEYCIILSMHIHCNVRLTQMHFVSHRNTSCVTDVFCWTQSVHLQHFCEVCIMEGCHWKFVKKNAISLCYTNHSTYSSRKILNDRFSDKQKLTTENNSAVMMWNDLLGTVKLHWHDLCHEWQAAWMYVLQAAGQIHPYTKTTATRVAVLWCMVMVWNFVHLHALLPFHYILSTTSKDIELTLCNINWRNWFLILWGKICSPNLI